MPERKQPHDAAASNAEHADTSEQLVQLFIKQQLLVVPEQLQQLVFEQLQFLVEQFKQQFKFIVEFVTTGGRLVAEPLLREQRRPVVAGLTEQPAEWKPKQQPEQR